MRSRVTRWFVSILVVLALIGGTTVQAMPPADVAHAATPDCAEMAMGHGADASSPSKGMTPDCMKSMQCLGIADRARWTSMVEAPVSYGPVVYWSVDNRLNGVSIPPPASPPRPV